MTNQSSTFSRGENNGEDDLRTTYGILEGGMNGKCFILVYDLGKSSQFALIKGYSILRELGLCSLIYVIRKRIFCIDLPKEWYVYTFLCIYFYLYVCVCIVLYNVCVGASQCYPSAPSGSDKICYAGSSQLSNSPLQIAGATSLGYFFQKRKYLQYYHIKQNIRKHL